jgi:hypothetical protein
MKVRFRIARVRNGKFIIVPLNDETTIPIPEGESFETLRTAAFTIEVDPSQFLIETSWDNDHKRVR